MDFPCNFESKNDFLSCLRYVPKFESWSDLDFCVYYDHLLKMRHNALQLCMCDVLFGRWEEEKIISNVFPGYDKYGSNLTPDIVFQDKEKNIVYVIDVGVTKNYYETIEKKREKYLPLVAELSLFLNMEVELMFFIFDLNKYNFLSEEKSFFKIFKGKRMDESFFNACMYEYDLKRRLIDDHVDRDFFHKYLRKKYNILDEVIGMKKDTTINEELLESIFNKKYPHSLNLEINEDQIIDFSKEFMDNEFLKANYYDKENNPEQYNEALEYIMKKQTDFDEKKYVTFANLFPSNEKILKKVFGEGSEQEMILNFCELVDNEWLECEENHESSFFIKNIVKHLLLVKNNKYLRNKFKTGYFQNEAQEVILKEEYLKTRNNNMGKCKSFYNFYANLKNLPTEVEINRSKSVIIPSKEMDSKSKSFYTDSGTQFYKHKFLEEKKSFKKSQPMTDSFVIDFYLDYFKGKNISCYEESLNEIKSFLLTDPNLIHDSEMVKKIKERCIFEYEPFVDHFLSRNYAKILWYNHLFYSQLMHLLSFSDKESQYSFFNCGDPNKLCIVIGGYKSKDTQTPKAFLDMVITKTPEFYKEEFFGNLYKIKLQKDLWLVVTGWRRMTLDKCTFMRDSFYSVFGSSISFFENIGLEKDDYFDEITALKTMISLCPKQQVQELLMDCRYAIMSSFSTYTNIEELLKTKFCPPYYCAFSCWIVKRLFVSLPRQTKRVLDDPNSIMTPKPVFEGESIVQKRKGGKINIYSIWTDHELISVEQILEETFIYVHTIKEPSNLFHEKIKAINTIIKFQEEFEKAGEEKYGKVNTYDELSSFAWNRFKDGKEKYIGYSANVVYNSFKNLIESLKPDFGRIINDVLSESIGEIVSTKAVIHDIGRHYELKDEEKKSFAKRIYKRFRKLNLIPEEDKDFDGFYKDYLKMDREKKKFILNNMSKYYKVKARHKVWETILDVLENNQDLSTVEDFLNLYLKKEEGELEADICIKSQYGSKREFYVINIAGKIYARIIEKFFYFLCKSCTSECISIPGDKKMLEMQKNLDKATYYCTTNKLKMIYVNGDCTKWSAAETLGSFITMCEVLKEYIPSGMYKLLRTGFSLWADKKINIPIELLEKVIPKSDYLMKIYSKEAIALEKPQIKSTQNFLQGMFNYASSLKASSCNYYVEKIWTILYPNSRLKVFHMEHSDDYIQIICFDTEEELKNYRALYKLFMKYHGYNDSARKTSCQSFFMEFVSLMSFNGQMLYPKIKKTKEINLSLPCTSYKSDIEAALSRSGECLRMGCSISFCLFFQRLHNYCVAEAYSILPGMINYVERDIWNEPIEMFGLPEQLPLFSLYCRGNINNYRLYTYGTAVEREKINCLFTLANKNKELEKISQDYEDYDNMLYSPYFLYESSNTIIKTFKQNFGLDYNFVKEFWENNPEYRFMKPVNPKNLANWLKVKFYDKAFIEAYTKVSRTRMTMRISRFVKNKCVKFVIDEGFYLHEDDTIRPNEMDVTNTFTIKEIYFKILDSREDEQIVMEKPTKTLLRADATATTIYDYLKHMTIFENLDILNPNVNVGCLTPHKPNWIHLKNSPSNLLQKILNPKNFLLDSRKVISEISLAKDIEQIEKYFNIHQGKKMSPMEVQNLFNDLRMCSDRRILYMGFDRKNETMNESITDQLIFNITKSRLFNVKSGTLSLIKNPFDEKVYYISSQIFAENTYQQCLETITLLYVILRRRYDFTKYEIINLLDTLKFRTRKDENTFQFSSWREVLNIFHSKFFESIPSLLELRKQAAYLRHVLLNVDDTIHDLINDVYSYSYHYEQKATYRNNRFEGKTICIFSYLNQNFKFQQIDNNIPTMYTNTKEKHINKCAWWVCLRLANLITEGDFKYRLYTYDWKKYVQEIAQKNSSCFIGFKNNGFFWDYSISGHGLPIFYEKELIPGRLFDKKLESDFIPFSNDYTLRVNIGKHTLFRLPFWNCRQYNVVEVEHSKYVLEGINLKYFFEYKLFECILKNKKPFKFPIKEIVIDKNVYNQTIKFAAKVGFNYDPFLHTKLGHDVQKMREKLHNDMIHRQKNRYDHNLTFDDSFDIKFEKTKKLIEEDKKKMDEVDISLFEGIELPDIDNLSEIDDELLLFEEEEGFRANLEQTEGYLEESIQKVLIETNYESMDLEGFLSSTKFRNFELVMPQKETIINLKKNIYGPISNVYSYQPILFDIIIEKNEIFDQNTDTCFSNCLDLCYKYGKCREEDYEIKTKILMLFLFYSKISPGNNAYLTTGSYHVQKTFTKFTLYRKYVVETIKIEEYKKKKPNILNSVLYMGKEKTILIKEIPWEYVDDDDFQSKNYRNYQQLYNEICYAIERNKNPDEIDLDSF